MDKLCYATGLLSASDAHKEYDRVAAESALTYGTYRVAVRNSALTLVNEGGAILATYPNQGSTTERKAVAYFTLVGGFVSTLFTADVALSMLTSAKDISATLSRKGDGKLGLERNIYSTLKNSEQSKLISLTANVSPTDRVFLTALSVYLGKATGLSDLGVNLVVPLVKVSVERRAAEGERQWPPVVRSFLGAYTVVSDDLIDDAFVLRSKAIEAYGAELLVYLQTLTSPNLGGKFVGGYIAGLLVRNKPKSLSYDSRVTWFTNVAVIASLFLHKHFGRRVEVSVTTARPYVPLESTDQLHESNSYFSRVALTRDRRILPTIVPELMMLAIDAVLDRNLERVSSISEAASIILLYYSVYGTNAIRLRRRPEVFPARINGKDNIVDLRKAEQVMSDKSKALRINCFRTLARGYASLTFALRMRYDIYRNNWRTLCDIDGRLAFDTVNFVPAGLIPGYLRDDYYKAVAFIKNNEKAVKGELL